MATKKKTKKKAKKKLVKPAKSKRTSRKKAASSKTAKRSQNVTKKKLSAKRSQKKRTQTKKQQKKKLSSKSQPRKRTVRPSALQFPTQSSGSRSGEQSGDLQGLSRREAADSESVNELLEEGNAFEAGAVMGVEDAGNAEGREVHTREVPEDDVPGEYLDEE